MLIIWLVIFAMIFVYNYAKYKEEGILYCFITLYLFWPPAFGIKGLPFNRLLLILFLLFSLWRHQFKVRLSCCDKRLLKILVVILSSMLIVFVYTWVFESTEFVDIINFVIDDILLVSVLISEINTMDKIDRCLNAVVGSSILYFICGIIQAITSVNLCDSLFLTIKPIVLTKRFGLTRISVTQSPITYGYYCVCFIVILMYLYNKTKKKIYKVLAYLGSMCVVLSISRGAILLLILYYLYYFLINIRKMVSQQKLQNIFIGLIIVLGGGMLFIIANRELFNTIMEIISATLNVFNKGKTFTGLENNDAYSSRMTQIVSAIEWNKYNNKSLFGFGMNAYKNDLIKWKWTYNNTWVDSVTNDTGYGDILVYGGFIYLISYIGLFILYTLKAIKSLVRNDYFVKQVIIIWIAMFWICNIQSIFFDYNLTNFMSSIIITYFINMMYIGDIKNGESNS